jgi:hypothetical protein
MKPLIDIHTSSGAKLIMSFNGKLAIPVIVVCLTAMVIFFAGKPSLKDAVTFYLMR